MAVVSCNELWPGRDGNVDFRRRRTYTRVFEVYTSDPLNEAFVVSTASGLPLRGQSYPFDFFAVCISINPKQDEADPLRWEVTCKYDSHPADMKQTQPDGSSKKPSEQDDNPLNDPPEWKFYFETTSKVLRTAFNRASPAYVQGDTYYTANGSEVSGGNAAPLGNNLPGQFANMAVMNSAGLPFDPPVEYDYALWCFSITGNLPYVDLQAMPKLKNSVNLTTWKGWPGRAVRCIGHEASTAWKNNIPYWRVSYNFCIKTDLWDLRILDCGWEELQLQANGQMRQVKILFPGGHEATGPVPLDGQGHRL